MSHIVDNLYCGKWGKRKIKGNEWSNRLGQNRAPVDTTLSWGQTRWIPLKRKDLNRPRRCSRLLTTTRLSEKMWQKVKEDKRNKAAKQKDRFVYSWKTSVLLSLSFTGFTPKTKEKRINAVCVLVFHWCVLHFPHRRSSQCLAELVTPHSRPLPDEKVDVFSFRQRRCS